MTTVPESSAERALSSAGLPSGYRAADLDLADRPLIDDAVAWGFATGTSPEEDALRPFVLAPNRIFGIWPEDAIVSGRPVGALAAMHASHPFHSFRVPGGTLSTAGLTSVVVHPGHRRRGLARAMVLAHLRRTAARGEALSALFASEPAIYGQFGYGRAAHHVALTLPRRPALRSVAGSEGLTVRVEHADVERHGSLVDEIHSSCRRPGWAPRPTPEFTASAFLDLPSQRRGAEPLRIASLWDDAGAPRGYALFSRKVTWGPDGAAAGTVRVREAVTPDGPSARTLWSFLCDLDLMTKVETPMLAADDALLNLLLDTRTVGLRTVDNVWVRLVDLPAALVGRAYASEVDVVLEVTDQLLPANAGRWRLRGRRHAGESEVRPTADPADLGLDVGELATAYLGGVTLGSLGAAGLVRELTPGALPRVSTAFGWPEAPVCGWVF